MMLTPLPPLAPAVCQGAKAEVRNDFTSGSLQHLYVTTHSHTLTLIHTHTHTQTHTHTPSDRGHQLGNAIIQTKYSPPLHSQSNELVHSQPRVQARTHTDTHTQQETTLAVLAIQGAAWQPQRMSSPPHVHGCGGLKLLEDQQAAVVLTAAVKPVCRSPVARIRVGRAETGCWCYPNPWAFPPR